MPAVRSQILGANAVTIVCAGNGNVCTLTKAQLQAFYQTTTGTAAQRKAAVVAWAAQSLADQSGGMLAAGLIVIDFNAATADFTGLLVNK